MSDEQQLRALFARAAELPREVEPPVQSLLARGRRRRAGRTFATALSASAIAVAAFALPPALHPRVPGHLVTGGPSGYIGPIVAPATGPTAAQIARFSWSALPPSPIGTDDQPLLAWTGKELIELGSSGQRAAAFNPASGRWHHIAAVQGRAGLANAVTAWTGSELFVTNGQVASCAASQPFGSCLPMAALYDPATNHWSTTPLPRTMDDLTDLTAVWTGDYVILAGVDRRLGTVSVAAYNPPSNSWQLLPPVLPRDHHADSIALAASESRLYLWSQWDQPHTPGPTFGVDVLVSRSGVPWHTVTGTWPQDRTVSSPTYTGHAFLFEPGQIWCGVCFPPFHSDPGYLASPVTLHRTSIPPGPLGQAGPAFLWTGRAIIAVSQDTVLAPHDPIRPDDLATWSPHTRTWYRIPTLPGRPPLPSLPIWTGHELLALTTTGALYALHS